MTGEPFNAMLVVKGVESVCGKAELLLQQWKGTSAAGGTTKNFIDAKFVKSQTTIWHNVVDPAYLIDGSSTRTLLTHVPEATPKEFEQAVAAAAEAYKTWRRTSIVRRHSCLVYSLPDRLQNLLRENSDAILVASSTILEQGKTFASIQGDLLRGLQVISAACDIPVALMGDTIKVSRDMDTSTRRLPIGVCASMTPFNFPASLSHDSAVGLPVALATGSTLILKPSERAPGVAMIIAELCEREHLPPGVLNIIHGTAPTVDAKGHQLRKRIYERRKTGKRVQANMAAKNYAVLMPDDMFHAAGQHCMAVSVGMLRVSFRQTTILHGTSHLHRRCAITDEGVSDILDGRGRGYEVARYHNGIWIGGTVIEVTASMHRYHEVIFGPVLLILRADTLDDTIDIVNANPFGNGAAISTQYNATARRIENAVEVG
ncbi:ALDH-like protein [Obba rivulosa]|uniref:ALDH-like protein n=1 Tax=Obba rivulosa TaxID=1052685 RepID=A0A8E2AWN3_9APHY|nr:ALDH-like protein [Obba rivulosa]